MKRILVAMSLGALLFAPSVASSKTKVVDGFFNVGDPASLDIFQDWYIEQFGSVTFTGGSLTAATLTIEGEAYYRVLTHPPSALWVPFAASCTASVGETCSNPGLKNVTANSLEFYAPSMFYLAVDVGANLPDPAPPGYFRDWPVSYTARTLNFEFLADPGVTQIGYQLDYTYYAIPEPAAWAQMLLGFGGLGAALRRRRVDAAAI